MLLRGLGTQAEYFFFFFDYWFLLCTSQKPLLALHNSEKRSRPLEAGW